MEVPKHESEDYTGLHGVQTAQLQHDEKQEEQSRQARDEEVLPLLQKAYPSPRDQVRKADYTWQTRPKKRKKAFLPA